MRSIEHGWISIAFNAIAVLGLLYLVLPVLMVFPLSIEPGAILRFPPQGFSLRWYGEYFQNEAWIESTILSFQIALGASGIATVTGTLAALGLAKTPPPVRNIFNVVMLSPIFLPTIVVAVAIYGVYASLQLVGTPLGLMFAHAVLTLPFVLLNVSVAVAAVPRSMEEAAMSLGASPTATFFHVTLPLISRGVAAGAVFAFLVSFDEIVIAMFLSGTEAVTLPKRMLDGLFYEITPMLAAVSVFLIIFNIVLAFVGFVLVRQRQ